MASVKVVWTTIGVLFVSVVAVVVILISDRSTDKLRLTVHSDDMLSSLRAIQGACRCLVKATPLGEEDEAKYWLLSFENRDSIS